MAKLPLYTDGTVKDNKCHEVITEMEVWSVAFLLRVASSHICPGSSESF
jgi:hypothetical protein